MLSQGTTFSFAGTTYTVTRVSVQRASQTRQRISTAHLGSNANAEEPYLEIWQPRADESGNTVEVDFLGSSGVQAGASGSLQISGSVSYGPTAATCASSNVTAAVGEVVRGSASFRIL